MKRLLGLVFFLTILASSISATGPCERNLVLKLAHCQMNIPCSLPDLLSADSKGLVQIDYLGWDENNNAHQYTVSFAGGIGIIYIDDLP